MTDIYLEKSQINS